MWEAASREPEGSVIERRTLLVALAGWLGGSALGCSSSGESAPSGSGGRDLANFRAVYGDPARRAEFLPFLRNVFHLVPEADFDALIAQAVAADPRDPRVYQWLAARLDGITPALAPVRYALPALAHQKREMARQTTLLLGTTREFEGYLEIGSHGRYLDLLRDRIRVEGLLYTTAPRPPSYSPEDVVDRGQLARVGTALPWSDYQPISRQWIADDSLGLVTVYIGLHHSRDEQREDYVRSLRRVLRPGGKLIVRDHDVTDTRMRHLVSLAHDVFNVGTGESWTTNEQERRNFYALGELIPLIERVGFECGPERLLQEGDPTQNTLLCFTKV